MDEVSAASLEAAHEDTVTAGGRSSTIQSCPKKSWIEIQLLDKLGKPVPGAEYKIVTPQGTEQTGYLDENGRAWVDGIDPGTCKVTFPKYDRREWKPL
jgi:hypothetical protein